MIHNLTFTEEELGFANTSNEPYSQVKYKAKEVYLIKRCHRCKFRPKKLSVSRLAEHIETKHDAAIPIRREEKFRPACSTYNIVKKRTNTSTDHYSCVSCWDHYESYEEFQHHVEEHGMPVCYKGALMEFTCFSCFSTFPASNRLRSMAHMKYVCEIENLPTTLDQGEEIFLPEIGVDDPVNETTLWKCTFCPFYIEQLQENQHKFQQHAVEQHSVVFSLIEQ